MKRLHLSALVIAALCTKAAVSQCWHGGIKHESEAGPHDPDPPGTAFDQSGVVMLSRIAVADIPGGNTMANDLWGYVSPSGREYALLGMRAGTAFIEVTTPTAPQLIDYVPHPAECCSDIKVYQHYAYVVTEGGGGMQVFDLSMIDVGEVSLVTTFADQNLGQAHNIAINQDSGFAYICGARNNPSAGGLFIVDIRVPQMPVYAGAWSDSYVHDVQVVTYSDGPYAGREIAFASCASTAYGLRIIDVTNKSAPVVISQINYPRKRYTHQACLTENRRYLYVNDEFDEQYYLYPTSTFIIDVSSLEQPFFVRSFTNGLPSVDHNLYIQGDFVYEANYSSGLRIFYSPNPGNTYEVGYFDTHAQDNDLGYYGAWTAYPYLPSGNILISDIENGLFIVNAAEALSRPTPLLTVDGWTLCCIMTAAMAGTGVMFIRRTTA